jgi:hypothetical protein
VIFLRAGIPLDLGFTATAACGDLGATAVTVYHLDSDARTVCEILRRPCRDRPVISARGGEGVLGVARDGVGGQQGTFPDAQTSRGFFGEGGVLHDHRRPDGRKSIATPGAGLRASVRGGTGK